MPLFLALRHQERRLFPSREAWVGLEMGKVKVKERQGTEKKVRVL